MLTPSKSRWRSFWAVLSIVAISNCDNDSAVWFNHGDNSLELINVPRIGEAVSPVIDLIPFPVDPSHDPNTILQDSLPPPCPPFPAFADAEFLDDQDFPASLGILAPAFPIDTLDITNWLSDVGDPYNLSETDILPPSLSLFPPLQLYEYTAGIDNIDSAPDTEEDTAPQATDGQDCVPEIPLIRQESENVLPPDRDVEEEPSSSRSNEERDSWRDQLHDVSENSILYNRSHDPVQIQINSQLRTPLWTADGERSQDDSRAWLTVGGTAFVAALFDALVRRRKRESSNGVYEEAPPNKKPRGTIVSQEDATESPQDVTRCPSPYAGSVYSCSGSESSQDFHSLVAEYLSKLEDVAIIRERFRQVADESRVLKEEKERMRRVGMELEEADQNWLDGYYERLIPLLKELKKAEDEAKNLRMKYYASGLVDEEEDPIESDEFVRFPILLPNSAAASVMRFNDRGNTHELQLWQEDSCFNDLYDESTDEEDTRSQRSDDFVKYPRLFQNPAAASDTRFNDRDNTHELQLWQGDPCFNDLYDDEDSIPLNGARLTGASMLTDKPEVKKHNHTSAASYETPWIPSPEKRFQGCNILLPSETEPIRNAKHQDLPFPRFNEFTDDILRRIAEFLSYEDVVQLSLTCHKLRTAYKPVLAETLRLGAERRTAVLLNQWTTRATLAFPLDADELLNNMGNSLVRTSSHIANSAPSTVMKPSEIVEDWLFSFRDFDLELVEEESSTPEAFPPLPGEQPHFKYPLPPGLVYTSNLLTVMMSEEDKNRETEHDSDKHMYDDAEMGIDEAEHTECFPEAENTSRSENEVSGRIPCTQKSENKTFEISTTSMSGDPTTVKSSPVSRTSPATPSLQTPPKMGTNIYNCPQCHYSCPRKCELKKHVKYHTKDHHCRMPNCKESFSREQDLARHEKSRIHHEESEQHCCPHTECQAKYTRKDNLMRHFRNKHCQNKSGKEKQRDKCEHVEDEHQGEDEDA